MLLPDTDAGTAVRVAQRLAVSLRSVSEYGFPVTLSLGIACAPGDGRTPDELRQAADVALYTAKRRGGDQVVETGALGEPCTGH